MSIKKLIIAAIAVFLAWSVLDFVIHHVILGQAYKDTAILWRPEREMLFIVMYASSIAVSFAFVSIYQFLVDKKNMKNAVLLGLLFGIGWGASMGYGSYSVMPITNFIAFIWFAGQVIEGVAAGIIAGLIIKK